MTENAGEGKDEIVSVEFCEWDEIPVQFFNSVHRPFKSFNPKQKITIKLLKEREYEESK